MAIAAPAEVIVTEKVITPQQMIRAWIREWSEGREFIENEEMREAARERFEGDGVFHAALLSYALEEMVTSEARTVFNRGRGRRISLGSESVTVAEFDRRVASGDRWAKWRHSYESVGDGKRKRLLDMTRDDLLEVAGERSKRANGELVQAGFLRSLARKMRAEQTVEDRYSAEELDAIHARIHKKVTKEAA